MVYSIKLKLEFAVLNQLMTLANSSVNHHQNLRIEEGNEKPTKPMTGRSKSTEYISSKYRKPTKRNTQDRPRPALDKSQSASPIQPDSQTSSFTPHHPNRFQWVPNLDRHTVIETKHVEHATNEKPSVLTNPAAFYRPARSRSRGDPSHDGLVRITDSEVLSPTLTGSTLNANTPRRGRRALRPPSLEIEGQVLPNGLLRSTRPSVSDWAQGPDSETSPDSDEIQLDPHGGFPTSPKSLGSVKHGRQMADRSMADLEFMTSALKE